MILLQILYNKLQTNSDEINLVSAYWKNITIDKLLIILLIVFFYFFKRNRVNFVTPEKEIVQSKKKNIDMDNLMLDINNSRTLYGLLSKN